jgi:hypothetical protein
VKAKQRRRAPRAAPSARSLRERILAAQDDRPTGARGRPPKWTLNETDRYFSLAVFVELARICNGIPRDRKRTPGRIYESVANTFHSSVGSVRRHHAQYRVGAQRMAFMLLIIEQKVRRS